MGLGKQSSNSVARSSNGSNRRHAFMALASVSLCLMIWVGAGWDTLGLYADPVIKELGINRTEYSVVFGILTMSQALLCLDVYGRVVHHFGLRKSLCLGGLFGTIAFFIWSTMNSLWMLYLGGCLFGVCCTFLTNNAVYSCVSYWFKSRRGMFVSIANGMGKVSGIICASVVAALIAAVGWRSAFLTATIVSAVGTVLVGLLYKGDPADLGEEAYGFADDEKQQGDEALEDGIPFRTIFKTPQFWLLGITYVIVGITCYGIMGNLALFTIDYGYADSQGTVMSVALFAAAAMMIPIGIICDKLGSKWSIVLAMLCVICAAVMFCQQSLDLWMVYLASFLLGTANDAINVPTGSSVAEAFGTLDYARKVGPVRFWVPFGVSFGPAVLNAFYDFGGGYTTGLLLFVGIAFVAAVIAFPATKRARRGR